ncbi:hypothetical protein Pelo_17323 [Pelomyxa schiedti]|nr:hypothetical protein Pelo_17323 [Pelomyxa schiedti]
MKPSAPTAKSQAMAVCCAAIVGRPTTTTAGPCPSMIQWARSPALFRQWAEDWVLPPLWDAVFRLPLEGSTGESWNQHKMVCVSVSITMGLVRISVFTSHSELGVRVCGCIGDDRVLVSSTNVSWSRGRNREKKYIIVDTTQAVLEERRYTAEASLSDWASVGFPQCNRRWIVGCRDVGAGWFLHIHRVSCGVPVGADVVVNGGQLPVVDELTLIGDTAVIRGCNSSHCRVLAFIDLPATFSNKKELVITRKAVGAGVAWMPDGSIWWVFPQDQLVKPISKHHLFSRPSTWSGATRFQVFHTGDLAHPSLCVPCSWACPERQTGIIISTSHNNNHGGKRMSDIEIEFSLHDGVSGMHIGVFRVTYSSLFTFKPYP